MCGRYYVDDDTAKEIEKVIRQVDAMIRDTSGLNMLHSVDIRPADLAPVIAAHENKLYVESIRWGIPAYDRLVINAKSETVREKKLFADSVEHRRIAIPAAGFYEWNARKEKYTFQKKTGSLMWFAGIYNLEKNEDRFVIITTEANASMRPVHDRMPLILDNNEIVPWILEEKATDKILNKAPELLDCSTEYEQLSLF